MAAARRTSRLLTPAGQRLVDDGAGDPGYQHVYQNRRNTGYGRAERQPLVPEAVGYRSEKDIHEL